MGDNCETVPPRKKQKVRDEKFYDDDIFDRKHTATGNNEPGPSNEASLGTEQVNTENNANFLENDVSHEEIEKLKEFQVLDEVKCNEGSEDEQSDSSDDKSVEVPDEEIEKMLEEDLPENLRGAPRHRDRPFVTIQKAVLEEKGVNQFEALPRDWMVVRHHSGMPVYLHRTSRVCSIAKPYFLGTGSARKHEIPLSAIPCLNYRRALEEEAKQKEIDADIQEKIRRATANQSTDNTSKDPPADSSPKKDSTIRVCPLSQLQGNDNALTDILTTNDKQQTGLEGSETREQGSAPDSCQSREPIILPGGIMMPPPRVETVADNWKTKNLTCDEVREYCSKLFKFKNINIMHFKRWADRRKYAKAHKTMQYPEMPGGTKLITLPAGTPETPGMGSKSKLDYVMNMNGNSYLSLFHEYVIRVLQKQLVYNFEQLENASTPYKATVVIGGMQYGVGCGSSKRQAKAAAAKASIQILIPAMRDVEPAAQTECDLAFFDLVAIEDPRVAEFCAATCEPSPHAILRACLLRNFGVGERTIVVETEKLEFQKISLTMKVGSHTATVVCNNKKSAKQRASQAILQKLHPIVESWGSMLRLYGSRSMKSSKEKKLEEQQITLLQGHATKNQPNYAVLNKLREEMLRLKERDAALAPIGRLLLSDTTLPEHSGANLNNVNL